MLHRSAGTSRIASSPATMLAQNPSVSVAPGKIAARPMIATSVVGRSGGVNRAAARSSTSRVPPTLTSACSAAIVVIEPRSAATWPIMNMP